ncbi:MAG TPA: hypothetical protein VJ866_18930 [Pyrinomonadaceae bacterium]|nr:hypothetical protein [Pyrinomonadaceae bacterium]
MRTQRTQADVSTFELYQGGEMRRRIADCRERLRRNRAARRIAERATPQTFEFAEELPEVPALAGLDAREEGG